jgi:hypothetical protein
MPEGISYTGLPPAQAITLVQSAEQAIDAHPLVGAFVGVQVCADTLTPPASARQRATTAIDRVFIRKAGHPLILFNRMRQV